MATRKIACILDGTVTPGHGGFINNHGQGATPKLFVGVVPAAVVGATFSCTTPLHGVTPITPVTIKSFVKGMLVITEGAVAGCGAVIMPIDRQVYVE